MIIGIPDDAYYSGRSESLLHLAASICFELYPDDFGYDHDEQTMEEYWAKCQPALSNGLTIVQQAQELGLKGRIAAVSPFLLISRDAREWPKNCSSLDVTFSAFRTVDAADLPKIHDTVCNIRLTPDQKLLFEEIRNHRNLIVHHGTVEQISPEKLLTYILKTYHWLHGSVNWQTSRAAYLKDDQLATLYSTDHVDFKLNREFGFTRNALSPSDFKDIYGFEKKTRWYWCQNCIQNCSDVDLEEKTCKLTPNSSKSNNIQCLVCGVVHEVLREECRETECLGNVIGEDSGEKVCLTCRHSYNPDT